MHVASTRNNVGNVGLRSVVRNSADRWSSHCRQRGVIFAETTEVPAEHSSHWTRKQYRLNREFPESRPRSGRSLISWMRPLSQTRVSGENLELRKTFTFIGSVIRSSTSCKLKWIDGWDEPGIQWIRWRRCVALAIIEQKDESPSFLLAGPAGIAVFLWELDSDRRAKTQTELLGYYVASPNPWLSVA